MRLTLTVLKVLLLLWLTLQGLSAIGQRGGRGMLASNKSNSERYNTQSVSMTSNDTFRLLSTRC